MPTNEPTSNFNWATEEVSELYSINGNDILVVNKVEPTNSYINSGVLAGQPFPRPYVNYSLSSHGEWIGYLRSGEIGNNYKWMDPSTTITDMANMFGGTWEDLGTSSFTMTGGPSSTQTLKLFNRTA